ncbi:low affinity immunoglobulin epsilon Fc receptor-like isoform X6 [Homarus americanus]|uniref:low affinity immunoglobulin epsilon Fc receptor-like isoform X6 n=1 Tax=Homarus americanus TaxID=6706 RepID=UPI001C46C228|nr:low affinity immunoglobulin epsilon Fc receptor-like isoform X6 [Homarus americanus]
MVTQTRLPLLLVVVLATVASSTCPSDWLQGEDVCMWVSSNKTKWYIAWEVCRNMDSHLGFIESQQENDFVEGVLVALNKSEVWSGLSDLKVEGSFVWWDEEAVTYTNFADGEPSANGHTGNDTDEYADQDCVALKHSNNFKWSDEYCFEDFYYFCRMDPSEE